MEPVTFEITEEEEIQLREYINRHNQLLKDSFDAGCALDGLKFRLAVQRGLKEIPSGAISLNGRNVTLSPSEEE